MITLATTNTLRGFGSAASVLTCTVFGMEKATTEDYKVIYQGQLAAAVATLYTVPALTTTFIRTMTIVNTDVVARTFQLLVNGTVASNQITPTYNIEAGGQAVYEDGRGWQFFTAGGSMITSLGGVLLNDVHSGYSDYQSIVEPSVPAGGTMRLYSRQISGRTLPKWMPPSGTDSCVQPQLWSKHIATYYPSSSTNGGTATLGGFGQPWTANGTVSHPTLSSGSLFNSLNRTRYANVITTTNQILGLTSFGAGTGFSWFRGDGGGRGGFFFVCRFAIDLWAAATCRIFVGLQSQATALVATDISAYTGDLCGFAHDIVDAGTQMWFVTRDNTTNNKVTITVPTIAAGNVYDMYMFCKPGDTTIYFRLDDLVNNTTIIDSSTTSNLPRTTVFMGPAATMSNGTANVTATTVAPGVSKIYLEADF